MKRRKNNKGDWEITKIAGLILVLFVLVVLVLAAYRYLRDPATTLGKTTLDELKSLSSIQAIHSKEYGDLSRGQRDDLLDSFAEKNGCQEYENALKEFEKPAATTTPNVDPKEEQLTIFKRLVRCYALQSTYQTHCTDAAATVDSHSKFFTDAEYKKTDRNKKIWIGDAYVYVGQCYQSNEDITTAVKYYTKFVDEYKDNTEENTIAQIRALIAQLTQAANDPNRATVVDEFKKMSSAYVQAQGTSDKTQLESAQTLVTSFISKYQSQKSVTYNSYIATAYYYRGQLEKQLAAISFSIGTEVGKDVILCNKLQTGFGPLVDFTSTPTYASERFAQTEDSAFTSTISSTVSAQALYEITNCYAGVDPNVPYVGEVANPSETGKYLTKLLVNYADDPATKLIVNYFDPKCDSVPDNTPDECHARGAEFTQTLPQNYRRLFRCYLQQSDDFAARDSTGFCLSCKTINSCAQYGTSAITCEADPCGFRNCVEGGGGVGSYFSDSCSSK